MPRTATKRRPHLVGGDEGRERRADRARVRLGRGRQRAAGRHLHLARRLGRETDQVLDVAAGDRAARLRCATSGRSGATRLRGGVTITSRTKHHPAQAMLLQACASRTWLQSCWPILALSSFTSWHATCSRQTYERSAEPPALVAVGHACIWLQERRARSCSGWHTRPRRKVRATARGRQERRCRLAAPPERHKSS